MSSRKVANSGSPVKCSPSILLTGYWMVLTFPVTVNWVSLAWFYFGIFAMFACLKLAFGFLHPYGHLDPIFLLLCASFHDLFKTWRLRKEIRSKKNPIYINWTTPTMEVNEGTHLISLVHRHTSLNQSCCYVKMTLPYGDVQAATTILR